MAQPAPKGLSPNFWERIEYGDQFCDAVRNNKVDINSKDADVGWIQEYAEKNLTPIQLQPQGAEKIYPKCGVSYKASLEEKLIKVNMALWQGRY